MQERIIDELKIGRKDTALDLSSDVFQQMKQNLNFKVDVEGRYNT
jgi:hypothetical protein